MDNNRASLKIIALIVGVAAVAGLLWYFYGVYAPADDSTGGESEIVGSEIFDDVQQPINDATDSIPETNPLDSQPNPFNLYANPFE